MVLTVLALRRQRQEDLYEFQASPVYTRSSRTPKATERERDSFNRLTDRWELLSIHTLRHGDYRAIIKGETRSGDLALWLSALVKDLGLIPRTHMAANNCP